ncbi:unannotated protein [freshwater metagenome]|uniref:Unannotated protein n=1 Tax=freshwater metagenome TaxID=449393 RepID=A0A6J5YIL7_9ZZZZ
MSNSFEFDEPDVVVPGTSGRPGQRTFFLQVIDQSRICSFKVEKQQVAALCEYLEGILTELPRLTGDQIVATPNALEPLGILWVVGRISVAYEEATDRIIIVADELLEFDPDDFDPEFDFEDPEALIAAGLDPSNARFSMTRAQVAAFIAVGNDLVRSGRSQCRLCGHPIDPEGHACPRLN